MRGHIAKKGSKFYVVLYDRTTKKYDWSRGFDTREDAEDHANKTSSHVMKGGELPKSKLVLKDYMESWLEGVKGNVAPTTFRSYSDICRKHIVPILGHIRLTRLTAPNIRAYQSKKLQDGLSPTTVRYHHSILYEILETAFVDGDVSGNVMSKVKPPKRVGREMKFWDEEQFKLFLGEAKRSSRYYGLYFAALMTGMRQGELLGLRWKDVNFMKRTFTINQIVYRLAGQLILKAPKTPNSKRTLNVGETLLEVLRTIREQQKIYKAQFGPDYEDRDLVFCQCDGKPLHASDFVRRDFKKLILAAKLPMIRFHDLRHTHATYLLTLGENIKVISARLGHSSPAFTLAVYAHLDAGLQELAVAKMESRLFPQRAESYEDA